MFRSVNILIDAKCLVSTKYFPTEKCLPFDKSLPSTCTKRLPSAKSLPTPKSLVFATFLVIHNHSIEENLSNMTKMSSSNNFWSKKINHSQMVILRSKSVGITILVGHWCVSGPIQV